MFSFGTETVKKFKTVFQSVMAGSSRIEKEGQPGINVRVKAKDNITITHEFDDSLELNSTRKQLHSSKVSNIFIFIKVVMTSFG